MAVFQRAFSLFPRNRIIGLKGTLMFNFHSYCQIPVQSLEWSLFPPAMRECSLPSHFLFCLLLTPRHPKFWPAVVAIAPLDFQDLSLKNNIFSIVLCQGRDGENSCPKYKQQKVAKKKSVCLLLSPHIGHSNNVSDNILLPSKIFCWPKF